VRIIVILNNIGLQVKTADSAASVKLHPEILQKTSLKRFVEQALLTFVRILRCNVAQDSEIEKNTKTWLISLYAEKVKLI